MSKLVIVESPGKAKTIKKYLGDGYEVMASVGHVRDLPQSSMGVNIENGFKPQYLTIQGKEKLIKQLKETAKNSECVYLATDPDREGEAISWHLAYLLGLPEDARDRVTFDEITSSGIKKGMSAPRAIDMDLVNSQQTRRILDRIVGYKISPLLWSTVKRGLSAGRVQSVAVRLIVDREREIEAFVPVEYWNIDAILRSSGSQKTFPARLYGKNGVEGELSIPDKATADAIVAELEDAEYKIASIKRGTRKRTPEPPFITSTLQQDASRRMGFTARRTMRAAQDLYEGVALEKGGPTGLITYMRTDSLRISDEADAAVKQYIAREFGEKYLCRYARTYKRKSASTVQDAHEAIRPTNVELTPDMVAKSLTPDQLKIYRLIWERFVASRMSDQLQNTVTVEITAGDYKLRATGHTIEFEGFAKLYEASQEEKTAAEPMLPELDEDTALRKKELRPQQKFTQPPPRYTEASLIKTLEENGIGRPSTYAPIIGTIIDRNYVERNQRQFVPTALGTVITDLMVDNFGNIVDVGYSSDMEKNLDRIEEGKLDWVKALERFYKDFDKSYQKAKVALSGKKVKVPEEVTDIKCELCGRNMVIKTGRYGKFLACPGFPECRNTKKLFVETKGFCPKCGGKMVERRSAKGRVFYACEKGRECGFMTWNQPTAERCPKCGSSLFSKKGKMPKLICEKEGCGYEAEPAPRDSERDAD